MADTLSIEERSDRMRLIRGKDTKPEILVRRVLSSMGYRYRLHSTKLPGRPDIVFSKRRQVIFVHGCFWHKHKKCRLARLPKSRLEYWVPKLELNRNRDARNEHMLRDEGWRVLIVWECEKRDLGRLKRRLQKFLDTPKSAIS